MVLVTPYIVRAVAQKQLSRPDDGFADPNDPSTVLLGRLNRIYGAAGKTEPPAATTTANTDSSSIERDGETIDDRLSHGDRQAPRRQRRCALLAVVGLAASLAGCYDAARRAARALSRPTIANAIRSR